MAIVNLTPDSFFDGGLMHSASLAADAVVRAVEAGADVIDLGAESTRPGARRIAESEQIARILPVLAEIERRDIDAVLSIDTTRAAVVEAACELSSRVAIVNDVSAARDDEAMLDIAARRGLGLVLMHRRVMPHDDRYSDQYDVEPEYEDVVEEVRAFLSQRVEAAAHAGIDAGRIVVDPGLGFGKSVADNLALVRETRRLKGIGAGVVSALSRKSFVGRVSLNRDSDPSERLTGTVALSAVHAWCGARIFRVHDVPEALECLRAVEAAMGTTEDVDAS